MPARRVWVAVYLRLCRSLVGVDQSRAPNTCQSTFRYRTALSITEKYSPCSTLRGRTLTQLRRAAPSSSRTVISVGRIVVRKLPSACCYPLPRALELIVALPVLLMMMLLPTLLLLLLPPEHRIDLPQSWTWQSAFAASAETRTPVLGAHWNEKEVACVWFRRACEARPARCWSVLSSQASRCARRMCAAL